MTPSREARARAGQTTAIALFTRDLRVHDNPVLAEAMRSAERVVPLFVLDPRLLRRSPRRTAFLLESLADLDESLRKLGGSLVLRRGDTTAEVSRVARQTNARSVFLAADVSVYAQRRELSLRRALPQLDIRALPGLFVLEPGEVAAVGATHYRMFTPYSRAWEREPWRPQVDMSQRLVQPEVESEVLPKPAPYSRAAGPPGGESAGRVLLRRWLAEGLVSYSELRNQPATDGTSRLSAYLRFGCVSPLETAIRAGVGEFRRQLCWRDFYAQLLWANPRTQTEDLKPRRHDWDDNSEALAAWKEGRTGYPIVDAAMRQLAGEGFIHNRARMVAASFLTKDLNLDWRLGAAHFDLLLLDGDPASNSGNWQWVAGTGTDTRPGRILNPARQAARFDPDGAYVRRHVPELAALEGKAVHQPSPGAAPSYPRPMIDHAEAARRFRDRPSWSPRRPP
jgi:deoxyribodipyrimidine photo-lyase